MAEQSTGGVATNAIAIVLGFIAIGTNGVSLFEGYRHVAVANSEAEQARLDAQETKDFSVVKLYFDDFANLKFCDGVDNVGLFVRAISNYSANSYQVLLADFQHRLHTCPKVQNADGTVDGSGATNLTTTSYAAQSAAYVSTAALNTTASLGSADFLKGYKIFIQYVADDDAAKRVQSIVSAAGGSAPGLERVSVAIKQTQVRIFKQDQRPLATKLASLIAPGHVDQIRIIDLEKIYPNLPADRMEIWVTDAQS